MKAYIRQKKQVVLQLVARVSPRMSDMIARVHPRLPLTYSRAKCILGKGKKLRPVNTKSRNSRDASPSKREEAVSVMQILAALMSKWCLTAPNYSLDNSTQTHHFRKYNFLENSRILNSLQVLRIRTDR